MSQKIEIDFIIDDMKALLSLKQQQAQYERLRKQLEKLNAEGNKSGSIADNVAKRIGQAAASFIGIGSAVAALASAASIIQSEVAEIKRQQLQSTDTQVAFSRNLRGALRNVGTDAKGKPNMSAPELQVFAEQQAADIGVAPATFTEALSGALAGVSPTSQEDVFKAGDIAQAVLKLWGDVGLDEMKIAAGSIADFMKTQNVSAETAAGALLKLGGMHRTADALPLSNYALPGAVRATKVGATIQEGMGGVSYLSQAAIDPNAQVTGAAWAKFVQELTSALPNMGSFQERMEFAQRTPEFQKVFFEGGTWDRRKLDKPNLGEGAVIPALKTMLANPTEFKAYQDYVKAAGDAASWTAVAQQNLEELNQSSVTALERLQQAGRGTVEGLDLGRSGMPGLNRQQVGEVLAASGAGWMQQQSAAWSAWMQELMGGDSSQIIRAQLEERVRQLRAPMGSGGVNAMGQPTPMSRPDLATPEMVAQAQKIESFLAHLDTQAGRYNANRQGDITQRLQGKSPADRLGNVEREVRSDNSLTQQEVATAITQVNTIVQDARVSGVDAETLKGLEETAKGLKDLIRALQANQAARGNRVQANGQPIPARPHPVSTPVREQRPLSATEQQLNDNAEAAIRRVAQKAKDNPSPTGIATGQQPTPTPTDQTRLTQETNRKLGELVKLMAQNTNAATATAKALSNSKPNKPQVVNVPQYGVKVRSKPVVASAQSNTGK